MCKTPEQIGLQPETQESNPEILEATKRDTLNVLSEKSPKEIPWYRPTSNIDEHPSGWKALSKDKKDASHYGDGGKLPEDDYYVKKESEELVANSKDTEE